MRTRIARRTLIGAGAAGLLAPFGAARAQTDPYQHPSFPAANAHLQTRNWRGLADLVASLPPQSACVLLDDLAEATPLNLDIGDLGQYPMGHTIAAALYVDWAWRHRGTGVARTITPEGRRNFAQALEDGRAHVLQAVADDPNDGVAYTIGFTIDKGRGDIAALDAGLAGYIMASRRPVGGLSAFANAASAKWLGSEQQAIAFAHRTFALDLPASAGLLPHVYYTELGARLMREQSPLTEEMLGVYFNQPSVRSDILGAHDMAQMVARDDDPFANWYADANFSYAFLVMNELDLARPHVLALGDYIGGHGPTSKIRAKP